MSKQPGHLDPRRAGRRRPRRLARRGARPLAPARDLPRVRAARSAPAPRGGARATTAPRRRGSSRPPRLEPLARERSPLPRWAALDGRVGDPGRGAPAAGRGPAAGHGRGGAAALRGLSRAATRSLTGDAPGGPAELLAGWGDKPVVAHDWKALIAAEDPAGLRRRTPIGRGRRPMRLAARARHARGGLPGGPGPARLPARGARRGAGPRRAR